MGDVESFRAHAIALEREAARRYEDLTAAMQTEGNAEVKVFFARMAYYSRKHLSEAMARGGFRDPPPMAPEEYDWPDGTGPETAVWAGVDGYIDRAEALRLALEAERRGHAYYAAIAALAQDAELRAMASEFATEEAEHVAELEKLIATSASAR